MRFPEELLSEFMWSLGGVGNKASKKDPRGRMLPETMRYSVFISCGVSLFRAANTRALQAYPHLVLRLKV